MIEARMNCAKCQVVRKVCRLLDGKGPKWCPTMISVNMMEKYLKIYDLPENSEFARQATIQEGECYADRDVKPFIMHPVKTRLEEIIDFSNKMGFSRLGVAFCGGLTHEASIFTEVLEKSGFDVVAVSCKVGGVPKERIGIQEWEKIRVGEFEPMCNPIAQAMILNEAKTDFNIMLGLCVGHDSLFLKYSEKMTTVFAVKDRVTCHNPLAVLYTANSYYQRFKKLEFGSDSEMKARLVAKER